MIRPLVSAVFVFVLASTAVAQSRLGETFEQAVDDLRQGRVAEAVKGFDAVVRLDDGVTPQLWQRGIALYFAGRHVDCRTQFERHRTVNPDDVENAAWHFLCAAKAESPARARERLLPVGPDPRAPMGAVYQMFAGTLTPDRVITVAGDNPSARFYAYLYVGIYYDALGRRDDALTHIALAADVRYARVGGYMHDMAVVHARFLRR